MCPGLILQAHFWTRSLRSLWEDVKGEQKTKAENLVNSECKNSTSTIEYVYTYVLRKKLGGANVQFYKCKRKKKYFLSYPFRITPPPMSCWHILHPGGYALPPFTICLWTNRRLWSLWRPTPGLTCDQTPCGHPKCILPLFRLPSPPLVSPLDCGEQQTSSRWCL